MLRAVRIRLGGVATAALCLAAVMGIALLVLGFAPLYENEGASSSDAQGQSQDSLVAVNGPGVLVVLVVPLLVTAAVSWALWQGARRLAWALIGLLGLGAALALLSIGVLVLPIVTALVVASVSAGTSTVDAPDAQTVA